MLLNPTTPSDEFFVPEALAGMIKSHIARPSVRDKQISIGPSSLGDPCEYCVADIMAARLPGAPPPRIQRFKLAPWIGTGVHLLLDSMFSGEPGWLTELKLDIGEIPDYGPITGSTDAYHQPSATIVDWKIVGDNTIAKLRRSGLAPVYQFQRNLYGRGVERRGLPIEYVMNVYIPRNGNSVNDIRFEVDHYNSDLAFEALMRAGEIWQRLQLHKSLDSFAQDEDCYRCNGFNYETGGLVRRAH